MVDAADPQDEENLSGGWYELAVELATRDGAVVDAAFEALSRVAGVEAAVGGSVLRLPDGPRVVCTFALVGDGEDDGPLWAVLGLPMGSLTRVDPRIGGYPFGDDDGASWRRPLDDWLVSVAVRVFDDVPFVSAMVGFDVSGDLSAAELAAGVPEERHHVGIVTVGDRPTYHPATA